MAIDEATWAAAKALCGRAFRSTLHCSVGSIGEDGAPHVSPIGSVLLAEPGRGIYFDIFASELGRNLDRDPRVMVMAVDGGWWFWLRSLARGRFGSPPALRLAGVAGPRRPATPAERDRWLRRVRRVRRLKGHDLLWGNLTHVRDLDFHEAVPVRVGRMDGGGIGDS